MPAIGAQQLVAYFVDEQRRATGQPVPRDAIGIAAKRIGAMLDDGVDAAVVARCIELVIERRQHPSTLPTFVLEAAAGPARPRREHIADRLLRNVIERREAP